MSVQPLILKLENYIDFNEREDEHLAALDFVHSEFGPHEELISEGNKEEKAYLLISGWGCSYKSLANGRRQIINFALPGDFVGVRPLFFRKSDYSFATVSQCRAYEIPRDQFRKIFFDYPRVGLAVLWCIAQEESIVAEHLLGLGQRSALESMSHMLLEMYYRLRLIGLASNGTFECPLNQEELGDALGITSVHVSRVLRQLRERDILMFQDHRVEILNTRKLIELCGFEPRYMDLKPNGNRLAW